MSGFLRSYEDRGETPPFLFVLNILVPGAPVVATVMYWALDHMPQQQQQQQGGGRGENEESSSPRASGLDSGYETFLRMLER